MLTPSTPRARLGIGRLHRLGSARGTSLDIGWDIGGFCLETTVIDEARWLIVFDSRAPDLETVVAHEVAHAMLGHDIADLEPSHEAIEAAARAQARAWGFKGFGVDEPM